MALLLNPKVFFIFAGVTSPGGVPSLVGISPALFTEEDPQRGVEENSGSVHPCGFWGVDSVSAEVSVHMLLRVARNDQLSLARHLCVDMI